MDKNGNSEWKRDERGRLQPVRIHELLGIPKSSGKSRNADGSMMEPKRSQPVLIKDLIKSMSSCKKKNPSERRMTIANARVTNARRQLYDEAPDRVTPGKAFSTTLGPSNGSKNTQPHGDANSHTKARAVQLLGISKSEGKHIVNGAGLRQPERVKDYMESWEKSQTVKQRGAGLRQPERVKDYMESWEKSQTVKQQVRKSIIGDLRTKNVRRKLYNAPSPAAPSRVVKKSIAASSQSQPRRSCLIPPNSIRDKHMNRQQNETIKEELPASLLNESEEKKSVTSWKSIAITAQSRDNDLLRNEETFEVKKKSVSTKNGEKSASDDEKIDEAEPQRPTVIMAAASARKILRSSSPKSSESKKSSLTLSRPPLKELKQDSFPQRRLDAEISSMEDLLGHSRSEFRDSSINLQSNSFLDRLEATRNSFVDIDRNTVRWLRASLKMSIQSTEENLFLMKKMLRSLDDLVDDDTSDTEIPMKIDEKNCLAEPIEKDRSTEKIDGRPEVPKIVVDQLFCNSEKIGENLDRSEKNGDNLDRAEKTGENLDRSEKSGDNIDHSRKIVENFERLAIETGNEENKENVSVDEDAKTGRRRSARLAALEIGRSPKNSDDSFSAIERELNIVHEKSTAVTPRAATPRERRKIDPRSRKSMREYMALKSMMNCLQTPDVKGLPTPKGETSDMSARIRAKRSISRQLMNELDDLYAESPQ